MVFYTMTDFTKYCLRDFIIIYNTKLGFEIWVLKVIYLGKVEYYCGDLDNVVFYAYYTRLTVHLSLQGLPSTIFPPGDV